MRRKLRPINASAAKEIYDGTGDHPKRCRGVEIHGHKNLGYPPLRVADVDLKGARVTLRDTKNRLDHRILLSRQALDIARAHCEGGAPEEPLFPIIDARKTLKATNASAGTSVQGHGLRATFASVAEGLVSAAVLKRMMNHAVAADVTLGHYVAKSDAQLRAGWQAVADWIEGRGARLRDAAKSESWQHDGSCRAKHEAA
jgi:hypothetical protein